jgi:predicted nuclease of predicted toxin-antitoxin system
MRVLIDECAPRALKNFLLKHGHQSRTVQEAGWSGKENGELLALAESEFDVLVTLDTNLRYQQNLAGRRIGIVVLFARSNRLIHLSPYFPACLQALEAIKPGEIVHVETAT